MVNPVDPPPTALPTLASTRASEVISLEDRVVSELRDTILRALKFRGWYLRDKHGALFQVTRAKFCLSVVLHWNLDWTGVRGRSGILALAKCSGGNIYVVDRKHPVFWIEWGPGEECGPPLLFERGKWEQHVRALDAARGDTNV